MKRRRIVRTAEVTIETEESILVPNRGAELRSGIVERPTLLWCPSCRQNVAMVAPEEAAQIAGVTTRMIYRRIETGRVHFLEISGRLMLVCVHSLATLGTSLDS